jgi:hypothetical protein
MGSPKTGYPWRYEQGSEEERCHEGRWAKVERCETPGCGEGIVECRRERGKEMKDWLKYYQVAATYSFLLRTGNFFVNGIEVVLPSWKARDSRMSCAARQSRQDH